ncbi:MAG: response regulator [Deltaproteobacteria bacterium]|nr:response regulator [Deltaproteobacteria bacterium]
MKGKRQKILIVDDDAEFLSVTREYLELLGYDVTGTPSPSAALEAASQGEFDLIIADYKMPGRTGLALLEEIRGNGVNTPFLLVSGQIDTITAEAVTTRGGSGILLKPFKLGELEGAVKRFLRPR